MMLIIDHIEIVLCTFRIQKGVFANQEIAFPPYNTKKIDLLRV